jgi:hypothetical protein
MTPPPKSRVFRLPKKELHTCDDKKRKMKHSQTKKGDIEIKPSTMLKPLETGTQEF